MKCRFSFAIAFLVAQEGRGLGFSYSLYLARKLNIIGENCAWNCVFIIVIPFVWQASLAVACVEIRPSAKGISLKYISSIDFVGLGFGKELLRLYTYTTKKVGNLISSLCFSFI